MATGSTWAPMVGPTRPACPTSDGLPPENSMGRQAAHPGLVQDNDAAPNLTFPGEAGRIGCKMTCWKRMSTEMNQTYLEVTFRRGQPLAAYYYLPRKLGQRSYKTVRVEPGLVIDYARNGKPIGIEITSPTKLSLRAFNRVLRDLGQPLLRRVDLGPLKAA